MIQTQGPFILNPPSRTEIVNCIIKNSTKLTQSWAFNFFLASVFECIISPNNTARYTLTQFWPIGAGISWEYDAIAMRTCYQRLGVYDAMRVSLGFHESYRAYPHSNDQEILLGQFENHTNINKAADRNVQHLCDILVDDTLQHHIHIINLLEIGQRVLTAVMNLKIREAQYREYFQPPRNQFTAEEVIAVLPRNVNF
jgi:hypothetical protein